MDRRLTSNSCSCSNCECSSAAVRGRGWRRGPGPAPTPVLSCPGTGRGAMPLDGGGGEGRKLADVSWKACWLDGRMLSDGAVDTGGGGDEVLWDDGCWGRLVGVEAVRRARAAARPCGFGGMELRSGMARLYRRIRDALAMGRYVQVCLSSWE